MARTALPVLAVLVLAGAASAAGEPTIEEMLREATRMAIKPGLPPNPDAAIRDSDYVRTMKARLEAEMGRRAGEFQRQGNNIGVGDVYFDVQKFDRAAEAYGAAVERNAQDWHVMHGGIHERMGRALFLLGKPEPAGKALEEAGSRAAGRGNRWVFERVEQVRKWGERLPEIQDQARQLREKAAANPKDADSRWKLLDMYRGELPLKLDEFTGLMQFRELYPEDSRVTVGECDWRLMDVLWYFGIRDEALRMCEKFLEKFPKHGACAPKSGEVLWRLGHYYEGLGRTQEAALTFRKLHDEWAESPHVTNGECSWKLGQVCEGLKYWRDALVYYKEVRDKYPDYWANRPGHEGRSQCVERIMEMTRLTGGR